jgi:transcriptional regulator with PAS, ATPase and Fis domain
MNKDFLELAKTTIYNLYQLIGDKRITVALTDTTGKLQFVFSDGKEPVAYDFQIAEPNAEFFNIPHTDDVYGLASCILNSNNQIIAYLGVFSEKEKKIFPFVKKTLETIKNSLENQLKIAEFTTNFEQVYAQFLGVMETIPLGTFVTDSQTKIIYANDAALKIFNVKKNDVIGQILDEYLSTEDLFKKMLEQGIETMDEDMVFDMPSGIVRCEVIVSLAKRTLYDYAGLVIKFKNVEYMNTFKKSKNEYKAYFQFDDIIGESPAIKEALRLSKIAARSMSNVLILGESGTGKELFAQAIHNHSPRREGPFIAVNCGALPQGLIESELFGYEGGAFTGSKKEGQPGKFELANGGTLFLDEIGDMPLYEQTRLLRVLQNKEVVRVGGKHVIPVNVRILTATNHDIEKQVLENKFRKDLFYRINVFSIVLPSLNDRREDIMPLCDVFIKKYRIKLNKDIKGIHPEALDVLLSHTWFGNIRELENAIERAVNIARGSEITLNDLPSNFAQNLKEEAYGIENINEPFTLSQAMERNFIISVMKEHGGNISKVSKAIGMSRSTLYRKMQVYNVNQYSYKSK